MLYLVATISTRGWGGDGGHAAKKGPETDSQLADGLNPHFGQFSFSWGGGLLLASNRFGACPLKSHVLAPSPSGGPAATISRAGATCCCLSSVIVTLVFFKVRL